jgi:hypothetical protein
MNDRVVQVLSRPAGWFAFQIAEVLVLGTLIKVLVPTGWSRAMQLEVVLPALVVVVFVNYRIRRRLPPFMATSRRPPPAGSA